MIAFQTCHCGGKRLNLLKAIFKPFAPYQTIDGTTQNCRFFHALDKRILYQGAASYGWPVPREFSFQIRKAPCHRTQTSVPHCGARIDRGCSKALYVVYETVCLTTPHVCL